VASRKIYPWVWRPSTPIYNTLVIHNSGVEITTNEALVQEPFLEVASVIVLSPINKAVVIQHGDFTGYQNLSSVSVNQGEKVSSKQTIGRVRTNGDTAKQ
jgi:hypothetical protein